MTAQTAKFAQHATLSGTTADSITFSYTGASQILVTNRDNTNTAYFTMGFNGAAATVAVAAADETFAVLPLQTVVLPISGLPTVSIVGSGGGYSVVIW
jgi:hypothetical protein